MLESNISASSFHCPCKKNIFPFLFLIKLRKVKNSHYHWQNTSSFSSADWCGICGGDNSTCQEERGVYNVTKYGYNSIVRIPARATNIEIRQHGFGRNSNDDTYIALR